SRPSSGARSRSRRSRPTTFSTSTAQSSGTWHGIDAASAPGREVDDLHLATVDVDPLRPRRPFAGPNRDRVRAFRKGEPPLIQAVGREPEAAVEIDRSIVGHAAESDEAIARLLGGARRLGILLLGRRGLGLRLVIR